MKDLTIIYYTANLAPEVFIQNTNRELLKAVGDTQIISVSHKPMNLGKNICVGEIGQSVLNIYKQVLIGAKEATTKYVAMAEDDTLYPPDHFEFRPIDESKFYYNDNRWSIYTWSDPPIFSNKHRMTMNVMICTRDLLVSALEERYNKYPNEADIPIKYWAEPGRYERGLGVTIQEGVKFSSKNPVIMFTHPQCLNFDSQGLFKKVGATPTPELPYWGKAEDIVKLYNNEIRFEHSNTRKE